MVALKLFFDLFSDLRRKSDVLQYVPQFLRNFLLPETRQVAWPTSPTATVIHVLLFFDFFCDNAIVMRTRCCGSSMRLGCRCRSAAPQRCAQLASPSRLVMTAMRTLRTSAPTTKLPPSARTGDTALLPSTTSPCRAKSRRSDHYVARNKNHEAKVRAGCAVSPHLLCSACSCADLLALVHGVELRNLHWHAAN